MTQKTAEEFQAAANEFTAEAAKCGFPAVVLMNTDKTTILNGTGEPSSLIKLLDQFKYLSTPRA